MAQFYNLEEAARVLGMGPDDLKQKAQQHEVRAFMDGGSWRFRVADVDELARRRGLGSDPDLSLSDLDPDLATLTAEGHDRDSGSDFDLSEFALDADAEPAGAGHPHHSAPEVDALSQADLLLDDASLPPGPAGNSSSTIIGLEPDTRPRAGSSSGIGKPGSTQSDVRLSTPYQSDVRPSPFESGLSDSEVTISPTAHADPADSDVRISPEIDPFSVDNRPLDPSASHIFTTSAATRKAPRPLIGPPAGSSGEIRPAGKSAGGEQPPVGPKSPEGNATRAGMPPPPSSDFDSGSDFELAALDDSDEFDTSPRPVKSPSDSDVTAFDPAQSGINLGRPSDSGINLQAPGFSGLGRSGLGPGSGIGMAPGDVHDLSGELSATALPVQKPVFDDDTDFEVEATPSAADDRTVQLDAASDFDLGDAGLTGHTSEVLALDEEDVDTNAATALGPALADDEGSSGEIEARAADSSIESPTPAAAASDWEIAPSTPAPAGRGAAPAPVLASAEARQEWGGLWVGFLMVSTVVMLLTAFVAADLLHNLYGFRGDTPVGTPLVKQLSGLVGK